MQQEMLVQQVHQEPQVLQEMVVPLAQVELLDLLETSVQQEVRERLV